MDQVQVNESFQRIHTTLLFCYPYSWIFLKFFLEIVFDIFCFSLCYETFCFLVDLNTAKSLKFSSNFISSFEEIHSCDISENKTFLSFWVSWKSLFFIFSFTNSFFSKSAYQLIMLETNMDFLKGLVFLQNFRVSSA